MKNTLVILIALALLPTSLAFSQGVYVQLGGGYGLSAGSQVIGENTNSTVPTATSHEGIFGSYGEGIKFGVTGGAMFSKNVGVELGANYLMGKTFEETDTFTGGNTVTKRSGTGIFFTPALVVAAPLESVTPYAKLGLLVGIPKGKIEMTSTNTFGGATHTTSSKEEDSGGLTLGYIGGLGALFSAGGSLGFFAELVLISGSWSPTTNELTEYAVDGVDRLADITDPTKQTFQRHKSREYKDSFTPTAASAANPNPNNPRMSVRHPYGSFGVNVGVRLTM